QLAEGEQQLAVPLVGGGVVGLERERCPVFLQSRGPLVVVLIDGAYRRVRLGERGIERERVLRGRLGAGQDLGWSDRIIVNAQRRRVGQADIREGIAGVLGNGLLEVFRRFHQRGCGPPVEEIEAAQVQV